jgi:hypothetical protein
MFIIIIIIIIIIFPVAWQHLVSHGLLIVEASQSQTHHTR